MRAGRAAGVCCAQGRIKHASAACELGTSLHELHCSFRPRPCARAGLWPHGDQPRWPHRLSARWPSPPSARRSCGRACDRCQCRQSRWLPCPHPLCPCARAGLRPRSRATRRSCRLSGGWAPAPQPFHPRRHPLRRSRRRFRPLTEGHSAESAESSRRVTHAATSAARHRPDHPPRHGPVPPKGQDLSIPYPVIAMRGQMARRGAEGGALPPARPRNDAIWPLMAARRAARSGPCRGMELAGPDPSSFPRRRPRAAHPAD